MTGNLLLFVELGNGKAYHTFTYQGADIQSMQFFDLEGNPVANPCYLPSVFRTVYDITEQKWYLPYGMSADAEWTARHYLGVKKMSKHIIKLVKERDDLGLKINKLKKFMKSDEFYNLEKADQELLKAQKNAMKTYKHILNERILWGVY